MNDKNNFEDAVGKFVKETESPQEETKKESKKATPQEKFAQEAREIAANRLSLQEEKALHNEEVKAQQRAIGMGFMEIPMKDLPSSGIFYPEGTKIHVRSASGGDIRHWSMVDETSLLAIDDANLPLLAIHCTWCHYTQLGKALQLLALNHTILVCTNTSTSLDSLFNATLLLRQSHKVDAQQCCNTHCKQTH